MSDLADRRFATHNPAHVGVDPTRTQSSNVTGASISCPNSSRATVHLSPQAGRGGTRGTIVHQYRLAIGSSSAGNSEITWQPLSVTITSSSMRAAEIAVGRRAVGLDREHHARLDLDRLVERDQRAR